MSRQQDHLTGCPLVCTPLLKRMTPAGALNVPFTSLLEGSSPAGVFKSPEELAQVLKAASVDLSRPIICTCGSGATAAVLAHALVQVGADLVRFWHRNRITCHCHCPVC